ncbi:Phytoene desaturase (neurosporene-forming) [Rhodobacteraceae bacterium THAF1]|uniref:phytoene desaturase n=1 Tax=Palleronia sp. THAF1 TaxID=2587842 RepID=UPI000F3CA99B|nr:phytoene desaturase [Palleronia sp. THAF1]QFU10219.1 Phytoene desaturase (neurosporene-forming) [Palleronia sp. THAF1]VDC16876.1 Phytoene desaturase (neurosporene-forming) [Rhodobacteraceae bacterium THAF1]
MVESQSEAVVIGAGLGGLAAAMRLGAKGYRVTVLDRLDSAGGRGSAVHKNGFRFDLGPTIVTVPQLFRELWATCGRDFDADVDLRALDPFYEIRWPDGSSFTARQDTDAMRAEVERLSPKDLRGYEKFLKDSEARYSFGFEDLGRRSMHKFADLVKVLPTFVKLRADRSVAAHAKKRFKDPRLQMAFSFHPLFIGGDPFNVTSMYILVSHLEKEFGVHYAMGGVAAIADAMVKVIRSQGGAVRFGAEVDEIRIAEGRAEGVTLVNGERLDAGLVVSNADAGHTYQRLLPGQKRWTEEKVNSRRWSMGLYVWYFGTKGTRDMWSDVGHHTILNGPRYQGLVHDIFLKGQLSDDMSLYIHRPTVTDPSAAPEGDDCFYALSPVPHLGHRDMVDWQAEEPKYRELVAAQLETVIPGFRERIAAEHVMTPNDFRDRYLSPYGSGFSIEPRILQSAWFRPHNVSEEAEGVYLVGAGTHPGAGLPGVISSAEVLGKLVPDAPAGGTERLAAE